MNYNNTLQRHPEQPIWLPASSQSSIKNFEPKALLRAADVPKPEHYPSAYFEEDAFVVQEPSSFYEVAHQKNKKKKSAAIAAGSQLEYEFLHLVKNKPFHCLELIYGTVPASTLQNTWALWVRCALCSGNSPFDTPEGRKGLLCLSADVEALIPQLQHLLVQWMKEHRRTLLPAATPPLVPMTDLHQRVYDFSQIYSEPLLQKYAWFLLECALTEGKAFHILRKELLFYYECFFCVLLAPASLVRRYIKLFEKR